MEGRERNRLGGSLAVCSQLLQGGVADLVSGLEKMQLFIYFSGLLPLQTKLSVALQEEGFFFCPEEVP